MSMGLPSGQLSFILRAGSDTLPHPLNLKRWKIQCDWKCQLCLPITVHFLNGCPSALQQGRYAWRHDSVLLTILLGLKPFLPPNCKVFADLDLWRAEDNPLATIPPHILSTPLRPDMVAIWPDRKINLLELTVPTNSTKGLDLARSRKQRAALPPSSSQSFNHLLSSNISRSQVSRLVHHPNPDYP